jgi:glucokinase
VKGARISGVIADKTVFIFSQAVGGSGSDLGMAVATDSAGKVYVAGTTASHDFPIVNAFQRKITKHRFEHAAKAIALCIRALIQARPGSRCPGPAKRLTSSHYW